MRHALQAGHDQWVPCLGIVASNVHAHTRLDECFIRLNYGTGKNDSPNFFRTSIVLLWGQRNSIPIIL